MSRSYFIKRVALFLLVIWAAASVNFFLPRLASGRDPIREKMAQLAASGGLRQDGIEAMVAAYQARFGLDRPLYEQYLSFLWDTARLDFGYSLANYPTRVSQMIGNALPWTMGLLAVATVMGFALGTLVGALVGWPRSPRWVRGLAVPMMTLSAIPFYLLALILLYVLGLQLELFPLSGGYSPGALPSLRPTFVLDVLHHAVLPALSIILSAVGLWGMGMRGMMVTTVGEDFIALARANGLKGRTIFLRYAVRNALLPQLTALGLSLAYIVTGQVLVEVVFAYPGVGSLLFKAIQVSDFTVINGIVLLTILSIGLITMLLDFLYPFLDPRISHHREASS
ncbi:ABC transporter permease [Candidatus Latescibacterota bacterium]